MTLKSIMTTLESLRGRLVYAQRLASLKSANVQANAEHTTTKAALTTLVDKYRNLKRTAKHLREALVQAQARESELIQTKRSEGEKVLQRVASADTARDHAARELEEVKAALEKEKRTSTHWNKKVSQTESGYWRKELNRFLMARLR